MHDPTNPFQDRSEVKKALKLKVFKNEADVKKEVKKLLDAHKWFWWMPPANGFGQTGIADFNALRGGIFLAVETKFGNNKPTPNQRGYLESITAEGGFAYLVSEKSIGWFAVWLKAFDASMIAASKNEQPTHEDGAALLNAIKAMTEGIAGVV